jgi:hypothetical protein
VELFFPSDARPDDPRERALLLAKTRRAGVYADASALIA